MNNIKLGVVGNGFVGKACSLSFLQVGGFDIYVYDPYVDMEGKETSHLYVSPTINDIVSNLDVKVIFVCVPTPMFEDGSCDVSIVDSVCSDIDSSSEVFNRQDITVVIKSTVVPGTTKNLNKKYKNIAVVFNPEFLREATYLEDFLNQDRIVIGYDKPISNDLELVYRTFLKNRKVKSELQYEDVVHTFDNSTSAEMVKYIANCFMATKISFANEIYQICDKLNVNYDDIVSVATLDKRLGPSYGWQVPGPIPVDGVFLFGFGLSCFPKDLNAMIYCAKKLGIDPKVMIAVWKKNIEVRPSAYHDWKNMKKALRKSDE